MKHKKKSDTRRVITNITLTIKLIIEVIGLITAIINFKK